MAIHSDENNFAAPGTSAPKAAAAAHPQTQNQTWSFFGNNALGGISRRATSEVLTKAHEAFVKQLTDQPLDARFGVELLKVDNTKTTDLRLSALIPTIKINGVDNVVAYHTVLLEGSADPIPSRTENINGAPIVVRRYASDVYSQRYSQSLHQSIHQSLSQSLNKSPEWCSINSSATTTMTLNVTLNVTILGTQSI